VAPLIRVAIVDDHPIVIDGLVRALADVPDLAVVGQATTVAQGREMLARPDVDVALVDIRLPDGFGTSLIAPAAEAGRPAVIMLSTFDLPQYVAAAVRLGAHVYVLKTAPTTEIAAAIRRVAAGGTAFSADQLRQGQSAPVRLTPRERSILELVRASRSNEEFAAELGVSRKTVEAYLTKLFERHDVTSRVELALRAEREGWLDVQVDGTGPAER
jgi:DNA-binding NarL/FixJ family response regulator